MDGSQIKRRLRNYLPNLPGDIFKIAIMLIFIFPFYWMIITALQRGDSNAAYPVAAELHAGGLHQHLFPRH